MALCARSGDDLRAYPYPDLTINVATLQLRVTYALPCVTVSVDSGQVSMVVLHL